MRIRTSGTYSESAKVDRFYTTKTSPYPYVSGGAIHGLAIGNTAVMTDEVIPNFQARKARGERFFNPMVRTTREQGTLRKTATLELRAKSPWSNSPLQYTKWKYIGDRAAVAAPYFLDEWGNKLYPMPSLASQEDLDAARLEVETRMLNERGRGDANLFETLAEYEQALSLVPGALRSFAGILKTSLGLLYSFTLKQAVGKGRKLSKDVSGAYLLYRYGAKPLMQDLVAVLELISTGAESPEVTTRSKIELSNAQTIAHGSGGDPIETLTAYVLETVTIRSMSLDRCHVGGISHALGLTGKNLLTLKWELIPFSFVVDWFINVGEFLGAYVPAIGYDNLGSCTVVHKRSVATLNLGVATLPSPLLQWGAILTQSGSGDQFDIITEEKERGTVSTTGVLAMKADFKLSKLTRILDAVALIRQLFK